MNAKEWKFIFWLLEEAMRHAYRRGQEDHTAGKSIEDKDLLIDQASRLLIKSRFEKLSKKP